jgi:hypothetical protein
MATEAESIASAVQDYKKSSNQVMKWQTELSKAQLVGQFAIGAKSKEGDVAQKV